MHLEEGEIRAYQDRQLEPAAAVRVESHLEACPGCRARAEAVHEQAARVRSRLAVLDEPQSCPNPAAARRKLSARLQQEHEQKERQPMWKQLTSKLSRPAWAGIALVAVLAISMAFPPVRAAANSFLQLFRVEQVRLLPMDTEALSQEMHSSKTLEALFTENVDVQRQGESQEVTTFKEAAALAPFAPRQLTGVEGPSRFMVEPGGTMTFKVDLEMARAALREMGRSDIQLPDSLEGAVVKMEVPVTVTTIIGECALPEPQDPDTQSSRPYRPIECTTFTQAPSPSISAPPELDLVQMGEIYLQVLGMSEEEAKLYAASVDWATTLVMPVPQNGRGEFEEIAVDGVQGLFIASEYSDNFSLMWVKDGTLYLLTGTGDQTKALELVASLK